MVNPQFFAHAVPIPNEPFFRVLAHLFSSFRMMGQFFVFYQIHIFRGNDSQSVMVEDGGSHTAPDYIQLGFCQIGKFHFYQCMVHINGPFSADGILESISDKPYHGVQRLRVPLQQDPLSVIQIVDGHVHRSVGVDSLAIPKPPLDRLRR